jgi:hypothetical protein
MSEDEDDPLYDEDGEDGWPYADDDEPEDDVLRGENERLAIGDIVANAGGVSFERVKPLTRADRRRARNAHYIVWTFENRPDVWTPPQLQAVLQFYYHGLNQSNAARRLGISFWSFRDRLRAAETIAMRAWAVEKDGAVDLVPHPSRYTRRRTKRGRTAT